VILETAVFFTAKVHEEHEELGRFGGILGKQAYSLHAASFTIQVNVSARVRVLYPAHFHLPLRATEWSGSDIPG
jgi:hypothetical protein